jgi:hypothetical protein
VTDAKGQFKVKFPVAGMYWLDADVKDNKTGAPGQGTPSGLRGHAGSDALMAGCPLPT